MIRAGQRDDQEFGTRGEAVRAMDEARKNLAARGLVLCESETEAFASVTPRSPELEWLTIGCDGAGDLR